MRGVCESKSAKVQIRPVNRASIAERLVNYLLGEAKARV
jgi:uncharacterized protein (UPF0297 family)